MPANNQQSLKEKKSSLPTSKGYPKTLGQTELYATTVGLTEHGIPLNSVCHTFRFANLISIGVRSTKRHVKQPAKLL
jgi:hypothetical protein